ncbi:methyl-accepting chemotaxis protein [Bdellovibrio sp. HCB185ZH]|uniref:methyl-accepting chemotaxis protein n=1 Tax=Bdellovibrio sp. HCB185ZH TaxID=3394235 RepID=UPI0039A5EDDC
MKTNHSIQLKMSVPIILIAILVFTAMNYLVAQNSLSTAERQAVDKSTAIAKAYANEMRVSVEQGLGIARTLSQHLQAAKKFNHTERGPLEHSFRNILESNKGLIGVWTAWEPNAWDGKDASFVNSEGSDKSGRFIPYLSYANGKATLGPLVDYEKAGAGDYYLVPKARGKETMVEPYLYPIDGVQVLMTSAVVPIFIDGKVAGVAGVDLPLKDLQRDAVKIKPFETSSAYLVTTSGNFVAHPDEKMLTKASNFAVAPEKFKAAFAKGESLVVTGLDPDLNEDCLYVVSPMTMGATDAPWSLVIRTPLKTVMADARAMIWNQVMIAVAGTLILLVAVLLIARYISKAVSSITDRLSKTGDHVTEAIEQLSLAGQGLSQSASESAASLEETVAALEEMSSMVRMNSDNAKQAAQLSAQSSESAGRGEVEMSSLMQSMDEISKSSKEIEEIINVIDDIAFQTNLLALNAAVEAARAGEQGKGFAVVAEAVRALAQRSAVAAKDINTLIKSNVSKIENGTQQAHRSGEVLKGIVTSVKKVSDLNLEISTASEEQATGIQQISKAMNQLDASVQSNAASSEEIAGTSTDISNQANIMKGATDEMNVFVHGDHHKKVA